MKPPLDQKDYERDRRTQEMRPPLPDGRYVYVQDGQDQVWVVPDVEPHLHPKVLGHRHLAKYAGDLTLRNGRITDITNCSGTFQFDEAEGLRDVVKVLRKTGWILEAGSVRLFSHSQAQRPIILE